MANRRNNNSNHHKTGNAGRSSGSGNAPSRKTGSSSRQQGARQSSKGRQAAARQNSSSRQSAPSSRSSSAKVTQFRKPLNINIGIIIFAVILLYVMYSIFRYATAKHVIGYEVRTGSISANRVYQGLALREEEVVPSEYSGYINYYSPETDRLAAGKLAYTIDESGKIQSYLAQNSSNDTAFSDSDYSALASDIVSFEEFFDPADFRTLYDFKTSFSGTIQKLTNNSILNDLSSQASSSLHYCNTEDTGYIVYSTDGYEGKTFADLVTSDFDTANYQKTDLANNSLVAEGDPAYKLETSEDWELVIQLSSKEEADALQEEGVVRVRFLKNQYESWATVGEIREIGDGRYLADLGLTNSMMNFCTDRFLSIELITSAVTGLKIPKSALIDDTFYVVPRDYVTTGAKSSQGVLRQIMDSDGEKSTEFISVTPYTKDDDDENYYLDRETLRDKDVLIKPDSTDTLTLSSAMTDTLTGVYNINKGYADFRQVTKIAENDDYAIVKANSTYGLREYDFIVLNASTMSPNEFLYE